MADASEPSGTMGIVLWVLRALTAALFLFAAYMKLSGNPQIVEEFAKVGLGDGFRIVTGVLELIGGVLILVPAYSPLAAFLLLLVDVGAFFAQVTRIHDDWIHPIPIAAILAAIIFIQRGALRARLGG
jgi:putative oxidoreductase